MFTPYDWQEGIGNRAQYIEGKLAQGAPALAISLTEGILVFTYRRQGRKIYEIFDRLIFAGLGQQSDIEALRVAALEFASREGYNRSEEDVTIQRVATAMSSPLKKAFSDFSASPIVARALFGEVGPTPADDLYYAVDYDGDYTMHRQAAVIAGSLESSKAIRAKLLLLDFESDPASMVETLKQIYLQSIDPEASSSSEDALEGLSPEAVLLERSDARENRFRLLTPEEF
jgi:proteasome alpha subunit